MSNDNVIKLVVRSDGKLMRASDLPLPGSSDWVKAVLRNFIRVYLDNEQSVEKVIYTQEHYDRLSLYVKGWLGDLFELIATPVEQYHEMGKKISTDSTLIEDFGEGDSNYTVSIIVDLCLYLGKDEEFINRVVSPLTNGQVYTFYMAVSNTLGRIMKQTGKDT